MSNRFRLSDKKAIEFGLKLNKSKRYRVDNKTKDKIKKFKIKRLFFDIETSPNVVYSWRIGYNINLPHENIIKERAIICISYKWQHEDKVHNLRWDNGCDKEMLGKFIKICNTADELIAHNGDRFDIKWIRTRAIYHRLPMFPKYRTLDTLKKARGSFNFNNNRLDYIAQYLGVGAKLKHDGFKMWVDVMNGDKKAMDKMVEYCNMDIIVLSDVFETMDNYITQNTHVGIHNLNDAHSCPKCGREEITLLKNDVTPMGTIRRMVQCNNCEFVYSLSNRKYLNAKA